MPPVEHYLAVIFILNFVLVIGAAILGYHLAPYLIRDRIADDEDRDQGVQRLRRLLSWIVALYMFLNCFAYFRRNTVFLLVVTALVMADIISQLVVRRRMEQPR